MFKLMVLLLAPLLALAQLTPNSITVTASRPAAGQPDTVRFNVTISSGIDATREEVIAAAAGAGISAENFTGVSYYSSNSGLPVGWSFSVAAPLSNMKATIGVLAALQNSMEKDRKYSLYFSVAGSETSVGDCKLPDLVADARAQATKLASAAGMSVGAIQAITAATNITGTARSGIGAVTAVSSPACSITARFALVGRF